MEEATQLGNQAVEQAGKWLVTAQDLITAYGLKVLAALVILIIGRWVAKWLRHVIERMMHKGKTDPIIIGFVSSIAYVALMVFVVIAALGQLGIQTTSFIAVLIVLPHFRELNRYNDDISRFSSIKKKISSL